MSDDDGKAIREARERARGFAMHEAARRAGRPGVFNDRVFAQGEGLALEAELSTMRRLLCELHPKLREIGPDAALVRFWHMVADEVSKC